MDQFAPAEERDPRPCFVSVKAIEDGDIIPSLSSRNKWCFWNSKNKASRLSTYLQFDMGLKIHLMAGDVSKNEDLTS